MSRAAMIGVACVLIWVCLRGIWSLYHVHQVATTQASQMRTRVYFPLFAWLSLITTGLIGSLTLAAALLPVATMQQLYERWNRPPVTGDRSGDDIGPLWWRIIWWRW